MEKQIMEKNLKKEISDYQISESFFNQSICISKMENLEIFSPELKEIQSYF